MVDTLTILEFPFAKVPQFSGRDIAYTTGDERLTPFFKYPVQLESFGQVMEDKGKENIDRSLLVEALQKQYQHLPDTQLALSQIVALREHNTFTVVTAHQPSLFTGPLYFIYKIASAINLSRSLNAHYPHHQVVPVFVMGGEDHDFEEINHLHLFGKTLTWENEESGATGRMSTKTLQPVLDSLSEILGTSPQANELCSILQDVCDHYPTYGQAMQALVHQLFGQEGLVVLNMDEPSLKRAFIPHLR
ncbi:MAG: bacillithiol biosynthesis BshC, partial [Bacteroidota bacterium]